MVRACSFAPKLGIPRTGHHTRQAAALTPVTHKFAIIITLNARSPDWNCAELWRPAMPFAIVHAAVQGDVPVSVAEQLLCAEPRVRPLRCWGCNSPLLAEH